MIISKSSIFIKDDSTIRALGQLGKVDDVRRHHNSALSGDFIAAVGPNSSRDFAAAVTDE